MLPEPMIAGIEVDFVTIAKLAVVIIPTLLFFVYKLISKCLRHRVKKLKIKKGIVSARSKTRGGTKWIRSIYTSVFLLSASGPLGVYLIKFQNALDNIGPFFLCIVLPFCAGIACLIRGILKRKHYLRKLALNNGVSFEVICPPQKQWILPMALGLPMLIYAVIAFVLGTVYQFGGEKLGISIIVAGILGGMFFLYGLLMCIVISRNKAKAVVVDNKVEPTNYPAAAEHPGDTQMI